LSYIGNKPANKAVVASDLDPAVITGQTALSTAPADTDEFLISDAGTLKRLDASLIGGGKIGQVVSTAKVDTFSTSSSSFTDITGLSVTITPSATNSKIYVMTNFQGRSDSGGGYPSFRMLRGSTLINSGTTAGSRVGGFLVMNVYNADSNTGMSISTAFLDSPSTTDATTYKIQMKQSGGNTAGVGSGGNDTDGAAYVRSASVITVMEVLA